MTKKITLFVFFSLYTLFILQAENTLYKDSIINIDEIVIKAEKADIESENLRIVSVISKLQIEALPVQNINELLDYMPGIDVRQRGVDGTQADITMRGGTFDQVLILLNGVNITDPQTGHLSLEIPVDIHMIERVEILQGTTMNKYGLSGFSGAINIITSGSNSNKILGRIVTGENGYINPSIALHRQLKKLHIASSLSYKKSDGYIENTDFEYYNAFIQTQYKHKKIGQINTQIGGQIKEWGANSFYSLRFPNQFEATKTLIASIDWNKRVKQFNFSASSYYRFHQDRFELFRDNKNAAPWYKQHNHHITQVSGVNFKTDYASQHGKSSLGIELRNENILSNTMGEKLLIPQDVPFEKEAQFTKSKNRMNVNYFAQHAFFINNFSASVGVSGNYNSLFENNYCWGANLGYAFHHNGRLYVNINRSLRLPTFTDLYYQSATQISNPDLQPEEALNLELGTKFKTERLQTSATIYYRNGTNNIDWIKLPSESKWKSTNHASIQAMGGEFSIAYNVKEIIPLTKEIAFNYSFTSLDKKSDEYISKYALDYLKNKASFTVFHETKKGNLGLSWKINFQDRNGEYLNKDNQKENYTPFTLLDASAYWKFKVHSNIKGKVFADINNILNTDYYDYGGLIQPGRWLKIGLEISL